MERNSSGFSAITSASSSQAKRKPPFAFTNGRIYVTVPAKEIRIGLLNVILKDCDVSREEFSRHL